MAQNELSILLSVKDEASKALAGFSKKLDDLQPAFKTMATAGTVAFGAISAVAYKTIKDFQGAETAQKQLEHAVLNVSHATKEQLKATEDLADALERKGVLDGDNIKTGLAQLSTFGLSNKAVQGLGGALADLAVNQFGVSASGEQLSDTANMIAKALNGQFGVLEKSGIRFSEAQQHAIQYGTEMEKVTAINEGFAQNLKFTNEVALQTSEGAMAKLSVQLGNVSENIGKALSPALLGLIEKVTPIVDKVVQWTGENPKLTMAILAVSAGISGLVAIVGMVGLVLPPIIAGFGVLATAVGAISLPVVLVIAGIVALIAIGVLLYKHWDEIKAKAVEVWDGLKLYFSDVLDGIKGMFTTIGDGIRLVWDTIWGTIRNVAVDTMNFVIGFIAIILDAFIPNWEAKLQALFVKWSEIWASIKKYVVDLWGGIILFITNQTRILSENVALIWTGIKDALGVVWGGIKELASSVWKSISDSVMGFINPIIDAIKKMVDLYDSASAKVSQPIRSAVSGVTSFLGGVVNSVMDRGASISGKRAGGGVVYAGDSYLVGEKGAEIFTPSRSGHITPNGGGIGTTVNVTITGNTFMSEQDFVDKVQRGIYSALATQLRL